MCMVEKRFNFASSLFRQKAAFFSGMANIGYRKKIYSRKEAKVSNSLSSDPRTRTKDWIICFGIDDGPKIAGERAKNRCDAGNARGQINRFISTTLHPVIIGASFSKPRHTTVAATVRHFRLTGARIARPEKKARPVRIGHASPPQIAPRVFSVTRWSKYVATSRSSQFSKKTAFSSPRTNRSVAPVRKCEPNAGRVCGIGRVKAFARSRLFVYERHDLSLETRILECAR